MYYFPVFELTMIFIARNIGAILKHIVEKMFLPTNIGYLKFAEFGVLWGCSSLKIGLLKGEKAITEKVETENSYTAHNHKYEKCFLDEGQKIPD